MPTEDNDAPNRHRFSMPAVVKSSAEKSWHSSNRCDCWESINAIKFFTFLISKDVLVNASDRVGMAILPYSDISRELVYRARYQIFKI